ncbi:S9 family peptidase, partial [bacterium]|nr:S9 family peptidase [bacterium]
MRSSYPARFLVFYLTIIALLAGACGKSAPQYPESRRVAQVDDYHGVQVEDPYRWLEEDSEETKAWVAAQNAVSRPYLEGLSKRQAIKERMTELWNFERYGVPFKTGGKYFYTHNNGLQDQSVLYVTPSMDGEARVLIDPNVFREDATVSLRNYTVSPNGQYIAYSISDGGSDWNSWKIRDVETGVDNEDELRFTKFTDASWSRDSKGFYYSRYPEGTNGKGDGSKPVSIYYHRLGTAQSEDRQIYAIPDHHLQNPYGEVTHDGRYLVINVHEGFTQNAIHYMNLSAANGQAVPLFDKWDALYTFLGNSGTEFYFDTNRDAPLGRVIAVDIRRPDPSNWRDVIPEAKERLQSASFVGGVFIARYLKDVRTQVK